MIFLGMELNILSKTNIASRASEKTSSLVVKAPK